MSASAGEKAQGGSGDSATADVAHADAGPMQQRVSEQLRGLIRSGKLLAGERLLEVHVARAFGVSRSPARAALQRLSSEGLLHKAEGRGYLITPFGAGERRTGKQTGGRTEGRTGARIAAHRADDRLALLPGMLPIEPVPRWERVYDEVEQALSSQMLFRSVRITEERLASCFDVSRTVARDVLVRMQGVGLVTRNRLGHWIAERVTPARIHDLYEIRWLLEPAALVQSAPRVGADRTRRMREHLLAALERMPAADSPELDRLEDALHIGLLAQCPNPQILRALEPTRVLLVSNRYLFDLYIGIPVEEISGSLREHLAVLDAVLRADWNAAAGTLAAHLRASCGYWQARLDRVASMPQPDIPRYLSPLEGG